MVNDYKYKISVIIPVYNVEEYIQRCVESVLGQTMDGLEIILVDDGSPDNCPKICDDYAQKYEHIFAFHKQNGGLSSARNAGLKNAHGKYIFFLDSDDWLDKDGLERLYIIAEETNVDFVRYRSIRTGWPGLPENTPTRVESPRELTGGYYSKERIERDIYPRLFATCQLTLGPIVGAWGSLYKSSLLADNNILFDENIRYSEDIPFNAEVVLHTNSFYFLDEPGTYHYCYNKNSISKSFKETRWQSCKYIIDDCFKLANNQDIFEKQLNYLIWFCIFVALNERKHLSDISDKKQYCRKIIKDDYINKARLFNGSFKVSVKQRMMMLLVKMHLYNVIAYL